MQGFCGFSILLKKGIIMVLIFVNLISYSESGSSSSLSCRRTSDCPQDHCCVLGMMRYSMPFCLPYGRENDPCQPFPDERHHRTDFTLTYPNDKTIHVDESYLLMCPCSTGFECSKKKASCELRDENNSDEAENRLEKKGN